MNWHIFAIGKPKLGFAKSGVEEYLPRITPFGSLSIAYLKAASREVESAALLKRSDGMFRIVLDETGDPLTSRAFAQKMSALEMRGVKNLAFLIGGADGHTDLLRCSAGMIFSVSRLTLQHELALVVLLEQIYRAHTIKAGLPYHRE